MASRYTLRRRTGDDLVQAGREDRLRERSGSWAGEGVTNEEIARRLGVHNSTVIRLINRRGRLAPSPIQPDRDTADLDTAAEPTGEPESTFAAERSASPAANRPG